MFEEFSRGFRGGFWRRGLCGFGFRFGGLGRGWRNLRYCRQINEKEEREILKERLQFLRDEIREIENRLGELDRKSDINNNS